MLEFGGALLTAAAMAAAWWFFWPAEANGALQMIAATSVAGGFLLVWGLLEPRDGGGMDG